VQAVDVWVSDLDTLASEASALSVLLSTDELERAARFHFERDRTRFVRCRALLRQLVAQAIGRDAKSLAFRYNAYGKPELDDVHFNVSHSANLAVIAIADAPIGIDVEAIDPAADVLSLARTAFSPDECAALAALPDDERISAFFRGWTRKEAYLKLLGTGFSLPSDSFTVSLDAELLTHVDDCALRDVDVPTGFACAIAGPREMPAARVHKV
jgi:4'-phosphopantetheinyl transferase